MKIQKRSCRSRVLLKNLYLNGDKSFHHGILDKESSYYEQIVQPLLLSNTDKDIIYWLKNIQLLKSEQFCSKRMAGAVCNGPMNWVEAKEWKQLDLFQWKCKLCRGKKSIRDDSVLEGLDCSFKDVIEILSGWCKGLHADKVGNFLGISDSVVQELYIRAASVAQKCMKSNSGGWQVGGPGVVVVVDTYPEGCTNTNPTRMSRPILCILEIKSIPQKYWLEVLDPFMRHDAEHIKSLKHHIVRTVESVVRPGSILITPATSTLCSYKDFQHLKALYPTIVSLKDLARHNSNRQNVFANLEVIWRQVLEICGEAQFHSGNYVDLYVLSHMWRMMYGEEAFEMLLYQISTMQ